MKKPQSLTFLLLLTLVICACSSVDMVTPAGSGPSQVVDIPSVTPTELAPVSTDVTPTFEGCGYVWASQALPDLSVKLNDALQAADPAMTGSAYAFGENCVYADGHSTFGAMETDYRVKVTVVDLKDEKALGASIIRVMDVISKLPADEIAGPQPGRVEFTFTKSDSENLSFNVSISKYKSLAPGLSGAEIFRLLSTNP
jgi:hypothetical protein